METEQTVFIVDDDAGVRDGLELLLESVRQPCEVYDSATSFLDAFDPRRGGCIILDVRMPRMSGLELQNELKARNCRLPIIFITGHGDIPMAVEAMRQGALDFIRKPFREHDLLERINEALAHDSRRSEDRSGRRRVRNRLESLSERELEVFERVAEGQMNKVIAHELGISERTVEVHRSQVMKKLQVKTLADLVRIKIESERINPPSA